MGPPTPGSAYSQPLSVDTGCSSPTSVRLSTPLSTSSHQPQQPNMYNTAPSTAGQTSGPPHYHHPADMPVSKPKSAS